MRSERSERKKSLDAKERFSFIIEKRKEEEKKIWKIKKKPLLISGLFRVYKKIKKYIDFYF